MFYEASQSIEMVALKKGKKQRYFKDKNRICAL
jgi:hypothetical protein